MLQIFGIILLEIGIWGKITHKHYANALHTGPSLLIAVGVIVIVVAFFGFCGAWKENKCMLCVVGN